jgi:5-methylcytosine-specific restriction endonuclease McrA
MSESPIGRKPPGHSHLTQIMNYYRKNAARAGVPFNLTRDQFLAIIVQNCAYCGAPPKESKNYSSKRLKKFFNGTIDHNGVDRVDNSKGYDTTNVVPCCKQCNWAKGNLPVAEFLSWISRVHTYTKRL